jgi:hypothetical protein
MDATLIVIDSEAELARARALVDRLWDSHDPADIARLKAQYPERQKRTEHDHGAAAACTLSRAR